MANTPNLLPVKLYVEYQNGTKWNDLLRKLTDYLTLPIDQFYTDFFDLRTCTTQGLDNWGRILNQSRNIYFYNYNENIFGFDTGIPADPLDTGYPQNFGHGNFFSFDANGLTLTDDQYRILLQFKYFSYTLDCSIGACVNAVNYYVRNYHPGETCQLIDGNMHFTYHFSYTLEPWEITMFRDNKVLPSPAGITYTLTWS